MNSKRLFKKGCAFSLALAMVLSSVPNVVKAADVSQPVSAEISFVDSEKFLAEIRKGDGIIGPEVTTSSETWTQKVDEATKEKIKASVNGFRSYQHLDKISYLDNTEQAWNDTMDGSIAMTLEDNISHGLNPDDGEFIHNKTQGGIKATDAAVLAFGVSYSSGAINADAAKRNINHIKGLIDDAGVRSLGHR